MATEPDFDDRITPLLLDEDLSEKEIAYWRTKEPWNFWPYVEEREEKGEEEPSRP